MINLAIHTQPDDETCGPTSLHAIYRYFGTNCALEDVVNTVERSLSGGTLASLLGKHALYQGFKTTLYVNNVTLFDPTWFKDSQACTQLLMAKLQAQMKHKRTRGIVHASQAYLDYLQAGGEICFHTLNLALFNTYFKRGLPILTGLSATYLYQSARERFDNFGRSFYDDIRGTPCGHFVVLCGYEAERNNVIVADPHRENPLSHDNYYKVSIDRLINAIMLGVLTYDANLLIIEPKDKHANHHCDR